MRELAGSPRWRERLSGVLRGSETVDTPAGYLDLLAGVGLGAGFAVVGVAVGVAGAAPGVGDAAGVAGGVGAAGAVKVVG